jgi:predicted aspartyl protease
MTRLNLRVSRNPGAADIFLRIKGIDAGYEWMSAIIDTGAETTLLPQTLMNSIEYRLTERGRAAVEQAGIAQQSFEVIEAIIKVSLEDLSGEQTAEFEALVWFSDTDEALLGMEGILDRAILHLDMPNLSGYLEFPD